MSVYPSIDIINSISGCRVTKIAGLAVKTLAKPLAKRIKHEFSRFPVGQKILIGVGQGTHQITSRLTILSAGYKVRSITPLESEKALASGADVLGEAVVFTVGVGVAVWDYSLSKEKERKKREEKTRVFKQNQENLQDKLNVLDKRLVALEDVVKAQSQSLFGPQNVESKEKPAILIDDCGVANNKNGTGTMDENEDTNRRKAGGQKGKGWVPFGWIFRGRGRDKS